MINDNNNSIWSNNYVSRLGILDHCNEIIQINNGIIREKNSSHQHKDVSEETSLKQHFDKECADLWLILSAYLGCDGIHGTEQIIHVSNLILERQEKFLRKENGL